MQHMLHLIPKRQDELAASAVSCGTFCFRVFIGWGRTRLQTAPPKLLVAAPAFQFGPCNVVQAQPCSRTTQLQPKGMLFIHQTVLLARPCIGNGGHAVSDQRRR